MTKKKHQILIRGEYAGHNGQGALYFGTRTYCNRDASTSLGIELEIALNDKDTTCKLCKKAIKKENKEYPELSIERFCRNLEVRPFQKKDIFILNLPNFNSFSSRKNSRRYVYLPN